MDIVLYVIGTALGCELVAGVVLLLLHAGYRWFPETTERCLLKIPAFRRFRERQEYEVFLDFADAVKREDYYVTQVFVDPVTGEEKREITYVSPTCSDPSIRVTRPPATGAEQPVSLPPTETQP